MSTANPSESEGAETLGIFADLPSETTQAETEQTEQTATPEEAAETNNDGAETQPSETEPPSRRVKAKLDGREIEFDVVTDDVDLELIPKGLMMEKDYRKKTAEASEYRKSLDAEKSKIDTALAELYDQIDYETKQLQTKEMEDLREIDPDEYDRKRLDAERKLSLFKKYREERDKELQEAQAKLAQEAVSKLPEVIPEWHDDAVMKEDAQKITAMLRSDGFTDSQIGQLYDPGAIKYLRKAALYDEIQSASLEKNRKRKVLKSSGSNSTAQSKPVDEPSIESIFYGNS